MSTTRPIPRRDGAGDVTAWVRSIADVVIGLMNGRSNNIGSVTLTASATSTTLTDPRISMQSVIEFMPKTANAATAKTSMYVTNRGNGAAKINHASSNTTDQQFDYTVIG